MPCNVPSLNRDLGRRRPRLGASSVYQTSSNELSRPRSTKTRIPPTGSPATDTTVSSTGARRFEARTVGAGISAGTVSSIVGQPQSHRPTTMAVRAGSRSWWTSWNETQPTPSHRLGGLGRSPGSCQWRLSHSSDLLLSYRRGSERRSRQDAKTSSVRDMEPSRAPAPSIGT
jgi:hypothetical protein